MVFQIAFDQVTGEVRDFALQRALVVGFGIDYPAVNADDVVNFLPVVISLAFDIQGADQSKMLLQARMPQRRENDVVVHQRVGIARL